MSDFPLNEQNENNIELDENVNADVTETEDEFSTVFGDPVQHKKRADKPHKKKRLMAIISACLAVAILVGGTVAVVKLIPEKDADGELGQSNQETVKVLEIKEDNVKKVTLTNSKGTFKFIPVRTENKSDSSNTSSSSTTVTTVWTVEGTEQKYTSSYAISDKVSSLISLEALRTIDGRTAEQCGFNKPLYTAVVEVADSESRKIEIGNSSADDLGRYLRVSGDDKIYLVDASTFGEFDFELLDLANTDSIKCVTATDDMKDYVGDDGAITTFDTITVSGKNFPETLVISAKNDGSQLSTYFNYTITAPEKRIADNVTDLFNAFINDISVSGAYAFNVDAASLKTVGLDNPYLTATIKIGNTSSTLKIAKVDDEYCAVIKDGSYMIHKVAASSFTFLDYSKEKFFSNMVFLENITDLSELTLTAGNESYTFGIAYDEEAESDSQFTITHKGEKITAGFFQNFYQEFVGLTFADYNLDFKGTQMDMTITVKFLKDGHTETVSLAKDSATKYACFVNGKLMGRVSSTDYNTLIKAIRNVSQNKDIRE